MSITNQLLEAIEKSELSLYRIAKDSQTPYAVLRRFAIGERGIKLETADKLAELFSMRLTKPQRPDVSK